MMKQFMILITCVFVLLTGCGSESSIRKELYDDSLKYYTLLNERVMAIETYTEEDKKNLKAYDEKYTAMLKELNKDERALSASIGSMAKSLDLINEVYLILDKDKVKSIVDGFVRSKLEAAKLLGLE